MMFEYGSHLPFSQVALLWIGRIVFVGIFAWLVYMLILHTIERTPRDHDDNRVRQILDQRPARGEIDAEESRTLQNLMAEDSHRYPTGANGPL